MDQTARRELQRKVLFQDRTRLRGGDAQTLVEIGRERRGARAYLSTGRARRHRNLSGVRRTDWPAVTASSSVRHDFRDHGPNGRNVLDGLFDGADIGYATPAVRATGQRRLNLFINLFRLRTSRARMTGSTSRFLRRFGAKTIPTPKWRGLSEGLATYRLDLVLQLGLFSPKLLILTFKLSDPPAQVLDLLIRRRGLGGLRARLASAWRTPSHASAYKHTPARMESNFFSRPNGAR